MATRLNVKLHPTIKQTNAQIDKLFRKFALGQIKIAAGKAAPTIERKVKLAMKKALFDNSTVKSIISGGLKFQLGIPDGIVKVSTIINKWVESIQVRLNPLASTPNLVLRVTGINSSYKDVLKLREAQQENVDASGQLTRRAKAGLAPKELPWLEWLLFEGTNIIISDYRFKIKESPTSRTDIAIMERGGTFRIDARHSGIASDNFVTRTIKELRPTILGIISSELIKKLR